MNETQIEFIRSVLPFAMQQSQRTGIDPRVIIAQTALETGFGQNMVGNNYFGIKGVGNQPTINANTIEFQDGQSYTTDADFRKFNNMQGSFDAYGDLMLRDMYEGVRNAPTALKQAQFLQDAGYATDPRYAEKLTNLINMMPTNLKGEIKNPDSLNELLSRKSSGRRQSLSGGLLDVFTNPARGMDRRMLANDLMLIFNSMSTRPNAGLAQSIGMEQQQLAEAKASRGAFGSLTKEKIAFAGQIRDDLRVNLKDYVEARTAYNQLLSIFPENTPGGTFAFITAFVKTTDPGSVVRGEEMSAVESSGNIGQKLKNIILANMDMSNRTARLPREIREQMMTVAYKAIQSRTQSAVTTYNGALNVAQKQGIPAEYIWFGIPPGDAEEPDFTVLEDVENEEKKNQAPSEPVVDTRTQTAIDIGVTIQEWNEMPPQDKIKFKD